MQILQWEFGGNSTADRWRELQHLVKEWEAHRPRTFEAILDLPGYPSPSDWNAEPWYSHNEHGLPLHCKFNPYNSPTIPKVGFRAQYAFKGNDPRMHSESVYNSEVNEIYSGKVPRMQCPEPA